VRGRRVTPEAGSHLAPTSTMKKPRKARQAEPSVEPEKGPEPESATQIEVPSDDAPAPEADIVRGGTRGAIVGGLLGGGGGAAIGGVYGLIEGAFRDEKKSRR
jgi:hypothetical protein